ncbi:hypothetical protein MUCCIDRAFT_111477 [Mucor lusitanicus CBS 277.49]|uniref:EF-hand domain-containing protein n=1 Tax=Mucor lusitanicus CBS 277.49 TaxID=747725 RepID=A0A168K8T8_MUCCL|nr:hypothetical protein MUCCIDRAFT_111477 [Mucor lusitanicus CBS 277.49]
MNRQCSTGRKSNSQKRKLDEKIRTHFNVFRVNMNKRSMQEDGGSSDSLQVISDLHSQPMDMHVPIQEANHYQPQRQYHQQHQHPSSNFDNNDDLLAWAQELPSAAFVDLIDTSNLDMALGQISPSFYQPVNIPLPNNVHQPTVNTSIHDHAMNFTSSFNNNHNNTPMPPHRSHHSYPSIFNYEQNTSDATFGSFSSSSTSTTNPFDHLNTVPNQPDVSPLNQHAHCSSMPSRPNPPTFKNGPSYLRASEDFILFFHAIDADDSGLITFDELKQYLRNKDANNTHFNNEAVMTLIEMFDTNKAIDKREFPDMLAFIKNWERCFLFLDEDKSGTIDYQEMHYAIQSLGFADLSHKLILRLLQKFDRSGSGLIDLDNFIVACVTLCRCKEIYEIMCIKFGSTSLPINLEQFIISFIWPTPL